MRAFGPDSVVSLHTMIKAKELAYADLQRFDGDPWLAKVPVAGLLADGDLRDRAALIDSGHAEAGRPAEPAGDTTDLAVVDRDSMMVPVMQSDFWEFGSGIVPEGSGVVLGNRGRPFSLDPASPDLLSGRKPPFHTLIPAFMVRGPVRIAFSIMGDFNQAPAQAQLVSNMVDHGMDIQAALEAPRFTVPSFDGCGVKLEDRVAPSVRAGLSALSHEIRLWGAFSPEAMGAGRPSCAMRARV